MRKIYNYVLVGIFGLFSSFTAQAQNQYWEVDADMVTAVEPNTNYVLSNAYNSATKYLSGTAFSTQAGDNTIYQFEEVGTNEQGDKTYRLKQIATGLYLEDPDLSGKNVSMTAQAARAFVFTAKLGVPSIYYKEADLVEHEIDRTTFTYGGGETGVAVKENALVFCNVNYKTTSYKYFPMYSSATDGWHQYASTNVWWVYKASKLSSYESFCLLMEDLFPSGSTPASKFFVGSNPGQISTEVFQKLQDAYDAAMKVMQNTELSATEYTKAGDDLKEALAEAKAARQPFKPGYYVIESRYASYGNGHAAIYDKGTQLGWQEFNGEEATFTLDNANNIWKIEESATNGQYYLQNYGTGNYVGKQASNNAIYPTGTEANRQAYDIVAQDATGDYFAIYNKTINSSYPALNVRSDKVVVSWSASGSAAGWRFKKVSDEAINALAEAIAQRYRNQEAVTLYENAQLALAKGISLKSEATKDGSFDKVGLAKDSTAFFTNAQEKTEGPLKNLVDNDEKTYFHSTWSVSLPEEKYHYLGVDLGEAVQCLDIKYARRNTNAAGTPKTIHVYACNALPENPKDAQWIDQGYIPFNYTYAANETYSTPGTANMVGITGIMMDEPYRYIRLDVEHTMNDTKSAGNLYFSLSEIRFFKGEYDAENSLINAVPEDVQKALKENIAKMQNIFENGEDVSAEAYDALDQSLKAFNAAFPDITLINDAIKEAEAQLQDAEEGDQLGYFAVGSKDELTKVINEVKEQIKPVMTVDEITTARGKITDAIQKFYAALITPANGDIVLIKSVTTGAAAENYLYAPSSDLSVIKWGGYSATSGIDSHLNSRLNYMWRFNKNEDGSITLQNLATGNYMGTATTLNELVKSTDTPDSLNYRSAKIPGVFNFILSDGFYANAQPTTMNLVAWNNASKSDNSAFEFVPVNDNWENDYYVSLSKNAQIVTLPIEITGLTSYGYLYHVLGVKNGAVQLESYGDNDVIPAGTPFIFIPTDDETWEGGTAFYPNAATLQDIKAEKAASSYNGLFGVLQSKEVKAGLGMLYKGEVITTVDGDVIAANTGYFTDALPTTDEDGETALKINGVISAINNAAVINNEKVDVITLSGITVRRQVKADNATKQLPAGLYIVGGKKVIVK